MSETISKLDEVVPFQALVTLHDSLQKISRKHKSCGTSFLNQEFCAEPSPVKKHFHIDPISLDIFTEQTESISSQVRNPFFESCLRNKIFVNLQSCLKQSASRRWCYYEWFYSNIDRALLLDQNDFESCLQHLFKNLKTRMLTKRQWSIIRRMMGKPRRCSPAFFNEEVNYLNEKRKKIRYLHQLKGFEVADMMQFKDLPDEIPMPMVVGTKVTAKVHPTGDGLRLFTGIVDAVDNLDNTYRVNFESNGIGPLSVLDIDVASEKYESMNLHMFIFKERPKLVKLQIDLQNTRSPIADVKTPLKLAETLLSDNISGTYGGFPIKFLLHMLKLSKLIKNKKDHVYKLKEMNSKAEISQPFKEILSNDFKSSYACLILELEKINNELNSIFENMQMIMQKLGPHGFSDPSDLLKREGEKTAAGLIEKAQRNLKNNQIKILITKLTSLMLHINQFSQKNCGSCQLLSLDAAVKDIKSNLKKENVSFFEDQIETSIEYLKNSLHGCESSLSAFDGDKKTLKIKDFDLNSAFEEDDFEDEEEEEVLNNILI
ncbi:protein lin-9 homolog [Hydra vulgaris]|uniref:Protein lin-9 homolog n=1 Tax=Hydra vulgaris TaxID=6087 RepID=A0ABM4C3B3_HYDVU